MIFDLCKYLKHVGEKPVASQLIQALARHSGSVEQFDELARSAFEIKDYLLAMELAEIDLSLSKDPRQVYDIQSNLINAYAHANYPEKALEMIAAQESVIPMDRDRDLKKAYALFLMTRRDEAEKILRDTLANPYTSDKIKTEINFNLGTYELYRDKFLEGLFRFLHYGRLMGNWSKPKLPYIQWDGSDIRGKRLLVVAEAGIGDEFINVRFLKHLQDRGIDPIWVTERKDLVDIFIRSGFKAMLRSDTRVVTKDMHWCHSMDLPVLLGLEYHELWYGPYITPKTTIVPDFLNTDKKRIGVRWQGNIHYDNDLHRSLNVRDLHNVLASDDVELYSLQRDEGAEDVYEFQDIVPLHEYHLNSFEDTLSIINHLDVVVTSCTSIAHAAAAMGKQTIVFVPISAYYTWCNTWGERSPWYGDNITVLRQTTPRSWDEPLARLRELI